jgi:membrane protein DedA with SNARE-associated domain
MQKIKEILKIISAPLILLMLYFSLAFLWKIFSLPSDDQMIKIVTGYFNRYGLLVVFISALIEGFLLLGQYFPGGFIIFLGVISAGKDILRVSGVVAVVSLAFFISYTLNYWVGKYGWYKLLVKFGLKKSLDDSKEKIIKQGMNVIFFSYWEPNLASLVATAAGILQTPLDRFSMYSLVGVIMWNIFWGTLVYSLGSFALQIMGLKYILLVFAIWVVLLMIKDYYSKYRKSKTPTQNLN